MSNDERWKEVPGYEGLYIASTNGRVAALRSGAPKIMTPKPINKYGHSMLGLTDVDKKKKCFYVHKIVLMTFVGPRPEGMESLHINGIATDCRLDNLRYGTRKENAADRVAHGNTPKGERNGRSKLTAGEVDQVKWLCAAGINQYLIASVYGVGQGQVSKIKRNEAWAH